MISLTGSKIHLRLSGLQIGLDSHSETAFVSHAHSDHAGKIGRAKTIIGSDATLDLMKCRNYLKHGDFQHVNSSFKDLKLLNAGHCLGSNQLHGQVGDKLFTYTGDFKLRNSLTSIGAEVRECDFLLMECTYGDPQYIFPDMAKVHDDLKKWIDLRQKRNGNVILGGYSLGKAQELVALLNEMKIAPLVNREVFDVCQVYNKHGVKLEAVLSETPEGQELLRKPFVSVLPMHQVGWQLARNIETHFQRRTDFALATGWSQKTSSNSFCISDHADFKELVEYVERANPKQVVCAFGPEKNFAKELQKRGFNAIALQDLDSKASFGDAIKIQAIPNSKQLNFDTF